MEREMNDNKIEIPETNAEKKNELGLPVPPKWLEAVAVCTLILIFFLQVIIGARHKTQTADENAHYTFGVNVLDGDTTQIVGGGGLMPASALGGLFVRWRQAVSDKPLTDLTVDIPSLFWARLPSALYGCIALLCIWALARMTGGSWPGFVALWIAAFSPNMIAHAKWITIDMASTAGLTLGMLGIIAYLMRPGWKRLPLLALGIAIAQGAKYTNLYLFAMFPLLAGLNIAFDLIKHEQARQIGKNVLWYMLGIAVTVVCYFTFINTVYGSWGPAKPLAERSIHGGVKAIAQLPVIRSIPLPLADDYMKGFEAAMQHNITGHNAYFHGQHSLHGFRAYFPTAFAFKTPLPTLIMLVLSGGLLIFGFRRRDRIDLFLFLPAMLYFLYFTFSITVNIGHRHLLPIYPLLFCFAARSVEVSPRFQRRVWPVIGVLCAWLAIETLLIAPHHISYFNQLIGGPKNGWKWFNDSNIDWGQDSWYVWEWQKKNEEKLIVNPPGPIPGLVTVNINRLTGIMGHTGSEFKWLTENYDPEFYITPVWPVYRVPNSVRQVELRMEASRTESKPGLTGKWRETKKNDDLQNEGLLHLPVWDKNAWTKMFNDIPLPEPSVGIIFDWELVTYAKCVGNNNFIIMHGKSFGIEIDNEVYLTNGSDDVTTKSFTPLNGYHLLRIFGKGRPEAMPLIMFNNQSLIRELYAPTRLPNEVENLQEGLAFTLYSDPNLDMQIEQGVHDVIDFRWGEDPPSVKLKSLMYSFRWEGFLNVKKEGVTAFTITSDDGARLWIDGVPVIDDWSPHPPHDASGAIWLEAGLHRLVLEYHNDIYGAMCVLKWAPPGEVNHVIPKDALFN